MQGKKEITPKALYNVHIDDLVPKDNFYRLLNKELNLHFLYKATAKYYGYEGQESIDPVVFFKICLVGYLNNINSDRKLIEYCSDSLAIRLFIKYDIDEALPWHSTISRTRQLYGEEVFLDLFRKILSMCIEKGMVSGKRQAVDSAFIKASASLDSLVEKEVVADVETYASELNENSEFKVTIQKKHEVEQRHKRREKLCSGFPGNEYAEGKEGDSGEFIQSKLLSNSTHYSPTDPDARISTKPGKPRNLNYLGQVSVDTERHVITGAMADLADKGDSHCLPDIAGQTIQNLKTNGLKIGQLLSDKGYSSSEALKYCEENGIDAYIPNFGRYKPEREGFIYNAALDQYECQRGNKAILTFKGIRNKAEYGYQNKQYGSSAKDCKSCCLRVQCCGEKATFKRLTDVADKEYYDRMHKKFTENKRYAQKMFRLRSSTVEPVLGTLINFMSMKRVNTRGLQLASKHVLMAALTYNLKKYMKFIGKTTVSKAIAMQTEVKTVFSTYFLIFWLILSHFKPICLRSENGKE
jgi:transposase/ribosomal protein S17E